MSSVICSACIVAKLYIVGVDDGNAKQGDNKLLQVVNSLQQFGRNFECKVAACSHHLRASNYRVVI